MDGLTFHDLFAIRESAYMMLEHAEFAYQRRDARHVLALTAAPWATACYQSGRDAGQFDAQAGRPRDSRITVDGNGEPFANGYHIGYLETEQ